MIATLMPFIRRLLLNLLLAAALLAGYTLWQQSGQLQRQASSLSAALRDSATLAERNRAQAEQLAAQDAAIQQQQAANRELASQLSALSRQHAAAAAKLEAAFHATPAAAAWGSAVIPDPVARLLDTTGLSAAPAANPDLPSGDGLRPAGAGADHQPAAGQQLAATPGGA
ncbi:hypothetical protein C2134_18295 [Chromobacterium sinusclupearum]|uniref:Uncharacterized protein n=1 Tax=Chromobacterium sinusclupearum TaxID=2077146 RepID=A0A2K4MJA4_9NEIS|nr:hypothetical protein [Chromobacterium sinusclupearum]POA97148.1 hypothetical protein C2134_18295 [Chromobacterium sinusclupearum]